MESEQAAELGIGSDLITGNVEVLRDLATVLQRSGPVLTEERALVRKLMRIARGEAHAVAGGEEERGRLAAAEQTAHSLFPRLFAEERLHAPVSVVRSDLLRERLDEFSGTEGSGPVIGVLDANKSGVTRQRWLCLDRDDAASVVRVGIEIILAVRIDEVDPANSVLNVEVVLEAKWNCLGPADEEEVVGELVGIDWTRPGTVAGKEFALRVFGPHGVGARYLAETALDRRGGLGSTMLDEWTKRFAHGRVGISCEDDPPTSFRQQLGIDPFDRRESRLRGDAMAPGELVQVTPFLVIRYATDRRLWPGEGFALGEIGDLMLSERRCEVLPTCPINPVEDERFAGWIGLHCVLQTSGRTDRTADARASSCSAPRWRHRGGTAFGNGRAQPMLLSCSF
jgi:hypothetical protein